MVKSESKLASLTHGAYNITTAGAGNHTPAPHDQPYIDSSLPSLEPEHIARPKRRATANIPTPSPTRKKIKRETTSKAPGKKVADGPSLPDINELPHNLGRFKILDAVVVSSTQESAARQAPAAPQTNDNTLPPPHEAAASKPRRNRVPKNPYGLTPGVSPFPEWQHPTTEECEEVNRLLSSVHGEVVAPKAIPPPSLTVSGCGEVPSILDALIRTLLSGATTGNNSAMAFQGLVRRFGILSEGIGKGSVDWNKVREAPAEEIYEAMKCGGLGVAKSKYIKQILEMVYTENKARRDALIELREGKEIDVEKVPGSANETEEQKENEIALANEHVLSLNHLHSLSKNEAMLEFVKFPGIGVKTAACVILFCLQRPCFAVDTHVFRLSKWLGWVPPEKVNEITAFSHLEVKIPDSLKYSLHQLFIRHGKACPRCRAITSESSEGWEDGCIIDHLVKRTGKRKGGPLKQTKLGSKTKKSTDGSLDEDE
ncbi:hypothetical protein FQN49_001771 [Arthroderma sp. PD_2]|nr:hypothetical protein FQN49_001771 [Arthroderma sp. PD_2]